MTLNAKSPSVAGFTLIEMLVSLAILSLMVAYAMLTIQQLSVMRDSEKAMRAQDDVASLQSHLRRTLASLRPIHDQQPGGLGPPAFQGHAETLTFAGTFDDHLVPGGIYRITYRLVDGVFEVSFAPDHDDKAKPKTVSAADGISSLQFFYFGSLAADAKPTWHREWTARQIPAALRVDVTKKTDGEERAYSTLVAIGTAKP